MEVSLTLKQKSDGNLIADLKTLVVKERAVLTEILHYLNEIETRRLYLPRGYSSLFAFMTEELGYSESAAQRRIVAMRLIREVPEVEEKIEKGEISLTVASQVGSFFRQENQKRQEQKANPITRGEKLGWLNTLQGTSRRECEKKLASVAPQTCLPKEKTRPLTLENTLIQFIANKSLMNKIEKLKTLLSHQNKNNTLEELFEKLTDLALDKLDPERRLQRRQKRESKKTHHPTLSPPPAEVKFNGSLRGGPQGGLTKQSQDKRPHPRYIPQPIRDQIWVRDQGQCQHKDLKTGKICRSKQRLELDHRYPYALGGENSAENLVLKCRGHNQWRGRALFGETGNTSLTLASD